MIFSKKHPLLFCIALILFGSAIAQETEKKEKCVRQGRFLIDAYYGLPFLSLKDNLYRVHDGFVLYTSIKNLNHTGAEVEYMIVDFIGLGLEYTRATINASYTINNADNYNVTIIKQRFLFKFTGHFLTTKRLDPYGGIGFGIRRANISSTNSADENNVSRLNFNENTLPFTLRAAVGIHYYPIKNIGLGLEVGAGGPIVQAGISIKI
jgi:opacity protein-like surface antigen